MFNNIRSKLSSISSTKKNVLVLTSGSVIGQALVIATSPLLSRMYHQDAFGLLALYTSLASIFASVFTGKYEQAIFHPVSEKKAINLMFFAVLLSLVLSILLFVGIFFSKQFHLNIPALNSLGDKAYIIPLTTFLIAINSCFQLWFQRKEDYVTVSINTLAQSCFLIALNFAFFFIGIKKFGLLLGYAAAMIFPIIMYAVVFFRKYDTKVLSDVNINTAKAAALEYINFPKFILVSEFVVTLSQQFFPILLTSLYSSTVVGLYSFSNRILRIPSILLSNSVWGVFRNEAIKVRTDRDAFRRLYVKTLRTLFRSGILPFLFLAIFGQIVFKLVFGESWGKAGLYSQIMAFYLFSEFMYYPLSSTFLIYNKQKINMWLQLLTLSGCITGVILGRYFGDDVLSIILMSTFGFFTNMLSLFLSYKIIGNE